MEMALQMRPLRGIAEAINEGQRGRRRAIRVTKTFGAAADSYKTHDIDDGDDVTTKWWTYGL